MTAKHFCAQLSREAGDPYIGLAVHAEFWLLIEYTGPWKRSAFEDNELPIQVKEWIALTRQDFPLSNLLFIRQHTRRLETITIFVGVTKEERQTLYRFQLARYEELLELDIPAILAGDERYDPFLHHEPVYTICTNGKHDQCCAKFGMPVYKEFSRLVGSQAWHCTHVGGDRYAANMICFPHGVYYSRVTVADVPLILTADQQRQIYIEKYRGRTCYAYPVQAADYYLRRQTDHLGLDDFHFTDLRQQGTKECWSIHFCSRADSTEHLFTIDYQRRDAPHYCQSRCPLAASIPTTHHFLVNSYAHVEPASIA